MRPPPPRSAQKVGLSQRELEWTARDLIREFSGTEQRLAQALANMMVTLITKNNAALASSMRADNQGDEAEG